jgi:hypothetical protein
MNEKRKLLEDYQNKDQKYNDENETRTTNQSYPLGQSSGGSKSMIRIRINKDRKIVSHLDTDL